MNGKSLFCSVLVLSAVFGFAGEKTVIDTKFDSKENADTWYYMGQLPLMQQRDEKFKKHLSLEKDGEISFLKVGGPFYIGCPLKPSVKINDSLIKLEITVCLRNFKGANAMSIAASDEPYYFYSPFPRKGARDSGIQVYGYQYGNDKNYLVYRKEGAESFLRPSTAPINLLGAKQNNQWVTWKLTLNHAERQLEFTRDGETEPSLIQRGVDLTGVELKKVFVKGACDYQWVKVVLVTKD